MPPPRPRWLKGDFEATAWAAGYAAAVARGCWHPVFGMSLALLAGTAGAYCRAALAAAHNPVNSTDAAELAAKRRLVREMMADWFLLPVHRVPLGALRPDGLDADISALC